jgi:hypothetical protein
LAALSDGISAFAMTPLVLDLRVPAAEQVHSEHDLGRALGGMAPRLLVAFASQPPEFPGLLFEKPEVPPKAISWQMFLRRRLVMLELFLLTQFEQTDVAPAIFKSVKGLFSEIVRLASLSFLAFKSKSPNLGNVAV